ncbi:hypothetical protein M404DRAFT_27138 [Pisolithus tinctorius Marx 270]|uniref:Uncharacterized protein n=1 Tax=Pisolithus tinctorius Marx 270 TaxID=870435 RepID=A0A0C3K1W5_PISTI|nr:hypothetical protein M404DRAFT_27138 [Pisolithus tinctorius Marx 270]
MSIRQSRTPYDQDLLPNLTQVMSEELQVGSNDNNQTIQGKLAKCKRCKAKAQEDAQLAEEARLEVERQEQAQLKEERACAEARGYALVGGSTRTGSNIKVMSPCCLCCTQTNMPCLHSTDSKKRHLACNWCNELKEHCQWPVKGETSQGAGPGVNKVKRKADMTSPHASEKKKRSWHPSAKVLEGAGDNKDDMEEGPLTKKTSVEAGASSVTGNQMECLIKAVEHVADNVVSLTVAQQEVSRNFYQFSQSYETYVKEHLEFLAPDVPSDRDTTDEEDRGIEGLDEELEGLRREEEESWSQSESGDQTSASSAGSQV